MLPYGVVDIGARGPAFHALDPAIAGGRVVDIARDRTFGIPGEHKVRVVRRALGRAPDIAARFAQALHGCQADHQAGPLVAGRGPAGAAPTAQTTRGEHGLFAAPFAGQRPDLAGGNGALVFSPLWRLWLAILFAQDIVLPLVKAHGPGGDVFLVIEVFGDPDIGYGAGHGIARIRPWREPLVRKEASSVVVEGIDKDHLDPQVLQPLAADGALKGGVDAAGRLGVAGPEHHHLGVLEGVLQQVILFRDAKSVAEPPLVHAAPVPTLPTVGVVIGIGAAHQVQEPEVGAVAVADVAPQVVRRASAHHRPGTELLLDPLDLVGDDLGRLVPTDPLVARDPPVLAVAVAVRIKVHPLHGVEHPLGRVDHRPPAQRVRRDGGLARRLKFPVPGLDGPGSRIGVIELHGRDAHDPAVLYVDKDRASRCPIGQFYYLSHILCSFQKAKPEISSSL